MNSQLAIALHILGFLASRRGASLTSAEMATTYGTSAVVLRRVLAKLQRAGLVETKRGAGGGSVLARDPATIHLREAYEAVTDSQEILTRNPGDCSGLVAPVLADYVDELYAEAEQALLATLEAVSVAEMDRVVGARIREAACNHPASE